MRRPALLVSLFLAAVPCAEAVQEAKGSGGAQFDADLLSDPARSAIDRLLADGLGRLRAPPFDLLPTELKQVKFRVRLADQGEPPTPAMSYTGGFAAMTFLLPNVDALPDGKPDGFDPVFTFFDDLAEMSLGYRSETIWSLPIALRAGIDRFYSQRLIAALDAAATGAGRAAGSYWPGKARARAGSLENLPPAHPLVQDRDRVVGLIERYEREHGAGALARDVKHISELKLDGHRLATRLLDALAPRAVGPDGKETVLEKVLADATFATREPWTGANAERMRGLDGPLGGGRPLTYGYVESESKAPALGNVSVRGGAPTLLLRTPLTGIWRLDDLQIQARRTILAKREQPDEQSALAKREADEASRRIFWVVLMDSNLHELVRWPFSQSLLPCGEFQWVKLPLSAVPYLPTRARDVQDSRDFWFVAFEFEPPSPEFDVEIATRPNAKGEHCFRSIPGRRLDGLPAAIDFAALVDIEGVNLGRNHPNLALKALISACNPPK